MDVQESRADLVLENGAEVNFKVSNDALGTPVIVSLQIAFPRGKPIPNGGIGATQLREIGINQLLAIWFAESSRSFLSPQQEARVWQFVRGEWPSGGRAGLPDRYYASLSYLYVKYCEEFPSSPTAALASELQVSTKTISTRLAQARKVGVLTATKSKISTGRAGGVLTPLGRQFITAVLGERF